MAKKDIEQYTVNQLAIGVIKQLKRIADGIEAQNKLHTDAYNRSFKTTVTGPAIEKVEIRMPLPARGDLSPGTATGETGTKAITDDQAPEGKASIAGAGNVASGVKANIPAAKKGGK
ncbi:MAG: hypothetical protein V4721_00540 [Bacteroidota bacterium]